MMTSCGLNGGPLVGKGEYPSYIACNIFTDTPHIYVGAEKVPRIMQDGRDGDEEIGYIVNITDSATIGYKSFEFKDLKKIAVTARGYANGTFEFRTKWDGEVVGSVDIGYTNVWVRYEAPVNIEDGVHDLYITFRGDGMTLLKSFELI